MKCDTAAQLAMRHLCVYHVLMRDHAGLFSLVHQDISSAQVDLPYQPRLCSPAEVEVAELGQEVGRAKPEILPDLAELFNQKGVSQQSLLIIILKLEQRVKQSWRCLVCVFVYSSKWNIVSYHFTYEFPAVSDIDREVTFEGQCPLGSKFPDCSKHDLNSIPPQLHYMASFHHILFTSCRL